MKPQRQQNGDYRYRGVRIKRDKRRDSYTLDGLSFDTLGDACRQVDTKFKGTTRYV